MKQIVIGRFYRLSNRSEIDPSAVGYCRCQRRVDSSVRLERFLINIFMVIIDLLFLM